MPHDDDQMLDAFVSNAVDFVCESAFLHLKGCADVALSRMSDAGRELWTEFIHMMDMVLAARVNTFKRGVVDSEALGMVYGTVWNIVTD